MNLNLRSVKRVHFIAIGGAAMHNLAIALKKKSYEVSGSDDEIFEPSRSRLQQQGLLPEKPGWFPEKLDDNSIEVILGMHARKDNPELVKARSLGLKIYSYPEYLYEQTRNKKRVVIAGSHGKTTITAMIIHVLKQCGRKFDFMVGSQIEGFENMVELSDENNLAIFEGDEYLSSPVDLRPKFIHYRPDIALITGISWDHINVFPTFEEYTKQFSNLTGIIEKNGLLIYFKGDKILSDICNDARNDIRLKVYHEHPCRKEDQSWKLLTDEGKEIKLQIFGRHNLQNISGAREVCRALQIGDDEFYEAIATFSGTRKRLQVLHNTSDYTCYMDFAHSPSKVMATVQAVKEKHPDRDLTAVLELHTFSSLNKSFIPQYRKSMELADQAVVYYDEHVLTHKGLESIGEKFIDESFQKKGLKVFTAREKLSEYLSELNKSRRVLLLMSSGNFGGLDLSAVTA